MNFVKSFDFFGVPARQIPSITGTGAPTTATEGAVGCLYMDTATGDLYKCTAAAGDVYTWVEAGNGNGLSNTASTLLITILRNGVYSTDQSANITALEIALGVSGGSEDSGGTETPDEPEIDVSLTSISATYSGGDVVEGTTLTELTGVVVTAHYSDGTSEAVTGYTLSGTIAVGTNTVTVTYQGMTTTLTVTGVAESSSPTGTLLYNWDFTKSLTDTVSGNTATLNGVGVAQDDSGLSINRNGSTTAHYVSFTTNIHSANRRYEFDVSKLAKTSNKNTYFLHCSGMAGLYFISNKWKFYTSTSWQFIDTELSDVGSFNGKTVAVVVNGDYSWDLYVDEELVAQSGEAVSKSNQTLTIGCTGTQAGDEDILITGLRVYDLGGV